MTPNELRVFADSIKDKMKVICDGQAEQLNITENRLYIDNIQIGLYDCRSTGRDSHFLVKGIMVFVDEEHLFKYLATKTYQDSAVQRIMEFFYEKHYVSFEFMEGELDMSAKELLTSLQATYYVNMTFIIDGVVHIQDDEQDIEIKARLQYANTFASCYAMIKETFEFAHNEGNHREFESVLTVAVRNNAFKLNTTKESLGVVLSESEVEKDESM